MKIGCIRLNVFFVHSDKNNCNMKSMNKNVDIKFSAHDAFLEEPSSGTLKIERLGSQII
jgi:hypothetical protein